MQMGLERSIQQEVGWARSDWSWVVSIDEDAGTVELGLEEHSNPPTRQVCVRVEQLHDGGS